MTEFRQLDYYWGICYIMKGAHTDHL